jgi:hypothetical protein
MPCHNFDCNESPYVCRGTPPLGLPPCPVVICPDHGPNPEACHYVEAGECLLKTRTDGTGSFSLHKQSARVFYERRNLSLAVKMKERP